MSDAKWTPATTQQAIALWVGGKDVADIAREFGVAPGEVLSRIAQAAIAGEDTTANEAPGASTAEASLPEAGVSKSGRAKSPVPKAATSKISEVDNVEPAVASELATKVGSPVSARSVPKRPAVQPAPTAVATKAPAAPRPSPLRLVPTPPALAIEQAPEADAPSASPTAARGYEAVALPAPVRTAKRLLVAADGGAGVPFMKATTLDCHFPLWADTETVSIERKRVCGCRALAGKSWCAHHLSAVFEPPRKPQPRVA